MKKLIEIVEKKAKKEFSNDDNLIANGVIDSIDFITIIAEIEKTFEIEIDFLELDPQQITSINSLWELINELG